MPFTEMVALIAVVSGITLAFIALLRLIGTLSTHKTIRQAVQANASSADVLLEKITQPQDTMGDDRIGVILLAIGLATLGASFTAGDTGGWTDYGIGASLFPLFTGAALCLRQFVVTRMQRRERGE